MTSPIHQPLYRLDTGGQLHPHLQQEYLLTNGIGAFAASTVLGCNIRRYHSLLIAATQPPLGRINTLSRLGEILHLDGPPEQVHEFSINQFEGGNIHPRGDRYLRRFELTDAAATWHFDVQGIAITKELQLVWGQNLAGIRYTLRPDRARPIRFELLPFVAMRDFHALRRGTGDTFDVRTDGPHMLVQPAGQPHVLHLRATTGEFEFRPDWWTNHKLPVESERGQDDLEDLFNPGRLVIELPTSPDPFTLTIWFALADPGTPDFDQLLATHPAYTTPATHVVAPRSAPLRQSEPPAPTTPPAVEVGSLSPIMQRLFRAAADFVVRRNRPDGKAGTTILAGYPWFADWGRDTMIALPGLLLVTGRFTEAKQVLSLFAQYVSEGMIPNKFDDYTNEPSYNTVDASLWFVHAAHEYLACSQDSETFDQLLLPACREIIRGYRQGTRFNIRMDETDGLINQGDPSTQLTWMDAKMGSTAFTPRHGKPVEINALWYNALRLMGEDQLAARVEQSFRKAFWLSPFRGLADVVSGSPTTVDGKSQDYARDSAIRPNQCFAVSLPHSPLTPEQQHAVVETCRRELLTPFGPRTLNRTDRNYRGHYTGNQWSRDGAYHNGTVWPWLIGPFLEAYLKVNQFSADARQQATRWLTPLLDHMTTAGCIGQIPECFDGDDPQRPVGTPAQAWSVAEVLRIAAMLEL